MGVERICSFTPAAGVDKWTLPNVDMRMEMLIPTFEFPLWMYRRGGKVERERVRLALITLIRLHTCTSN